MQTVLYERAPILPVLQKHTVFSVHVRSLSSPEISQRASSSSFTLKHPAHCATPAAYVHTKHSWLPQHIVSFFFFPSYWYLHTTLTRNQLMLCHRWHDCIEEIRFYLHKGRPCKDSEAQHVSPGSLIHQLGCSLICPTDQKMLWLKYVKKTLLFHHSYVLRAELVMSGTWESPSPFDASASVM